MKFSVNWLREFVDLPENPEEIADLLTRAGVETENIETCGANVDKVIVSQITASSRHPNADRLTVCEVDDASGTKRQIVCGATNYKVSDRVPLALPGAKLPNGTEIRKSKLRGVESEGMLCSPIELGLGDDASGLLILPPDAKIGTPIGDLFPEDTILDVEITPNRGDLLSHFGLAREIAALTGKKLKSTPRESKIAIKKTGVTITATRECPFFSARKIDNVKVGPSPQWLRTKIESVGSRSINNIVDISNFVMLELGQPTHAFDADKLTGDINVRLARDGEKFLALDGKTYSLKPDNLVVGISIKPKAIDEILTGFGLKKTSAAKTTKWKIPSYRRDLQRDVDLIEEVVRAYGAKKIPGTDRSRYTPSSAADRAHDLESAWRTRLAAVGLNEVRTSKLLPRERFAFSEGAIELRNPLSEDAVALRPSILAGLLAVLDRNIRAGAERVAIFEIGRTFIPPSGKEERHLGVLLWGNVAGAGNWRSVSNRGVDLFDLKGALENVVPKLSLRPGKFPDLALPVDVFSGDRMVGFGGQLSSAKATAS